MGHFCFCPADNSNRGGNLGLYLTARDNEQIERARKALVLEEVDGYRLDRQKGGILNTCADGDQFFDLVTKEAEFVKARCNGARIHTFGWNGGALRLTVRGIRWRWLGLMLFKLFQLILERLGVAVIELFGEAAAARTMKNMDTAALYAHAPCGYAYGQGLDFNTVGDRLFAAKENVKQAIPGIKVACFVHVRHLDGRPRTYFVSRDNWLRYRAAA